MIYSNVDMSCTNGVPECDCGLYNQTISHIIGESHQIANSTDHRKTS